MGRCARATSTRADTCCSLPLNILLTAPAIGESSTPDVAEARGVERVACMAAWKTASSARFVRLSCAEEAPLPRGVIGTLMLPAEPGPARGVAARLPFV